AAPSIPLGTTQQLTATGSYDNGLTQDLTGQVTWATSPSAILDVSNAAASAGLATPLAKGTTTVTATLSGVSGQTMATVTDATLSGISITVTSTICPIKYDVFATATGTFSDGTTRDLTRLVIWASSNTHIAPVSNVSPTWGQIDGNSPGVATITATFEGK